MPSMSGPSPILTYCPENVALCADLLQKDALVAVPTETVYGLAGNGFSQTAVRRIFETKGRPLIDPLICHFHDAASALACVEGSDEAERLAAHFWPGPLTLVLPKKNRIPDLVTAGLPSAAIRVPAHPALRDLLAQIDFPLAAPSANPFGYVSPTRAEHVATTLGNRIAAILDAGPCEHGVESTIVDLRDPGKPRILRPGPISSEALGTVLGIPVREGTPVNRDGEAQTAPGMLSKHYSPHARITILANGKSPETNLLERADAGTALLFNQRPKTPPATQAHIFWFSEDARLDTIAKNFFDLIQRCDQAGYQNLIIEAAPETGLGIAINDRLRRAAAKSDC